MWPTCEKRPHLYRRNGTISQLTGAWRPSRGFLPAAPQTDGVSAPHFDRLKLRRPSASGDGDTDAGGSLVDKGYAMPGETRSGVFAIDIPRGTTTLTIADDQDAPIARSQIDTSKEASAGRAKPTHGAFA